MMQTLVPAPLLSLALFVTWLLLNGSVAVAQIVLGAALAIAVPSWTERPRPDRPRLTAPGTAMRLAVVVLFDIVVSAFQVARRILGPEDRIRPGFVWVPLDLADPHAIVALAGIVTMTPGTLSADLSDDHRHLLVHAFHVGDEAELIASIKQRYEVPLARIFEAPSAARPPEGGRRPSRRDRAQREGANQAAARPPEGGRRPSRRDRAPREGAN